MWSPIRTRTSLPSNTNRIQVLVLTPYKVNIPHAFPLKPAHHYHKPTLLYFSGPLDCFPHCGALPLLIYVEGAGYMTSPSRIRITLLQVES